MKSIGLSNVFDLNVDVGVSKDNVMPISNVSAIGEVADTLLVEDKLIIDTTNTILVEPSFSSLCTPDGQNIAQPYFTTTGSF